MPKGRHNKRLRLSESQLMWSDACRCDQADVACENCFDIDKDSDYESFQVLYSTMEKSYQKRNNLFCLGRNHNFVQVLWKTPVVDISFRKISFVVVVVICLLLLLLLLLLFLHY